MTRYADPTRCPDCGAPISYGADFCARCALSLRGETAQRLFSTLSQADALLAVLRESSAPVAVPTGASVSQAPAGPDPRPLAPPYPTSSHVPTGPRPGLSAASVPKILLTLGAGCLLVAALVFLAVTWSVMGVGGRTATLVGLTVVAGGLAALMARRGLRGAAEALALVGYGLLSLDIVGADNAGWFGDLTMSTFLLVLGLALAVAGVGGALAVRRTEVGVLTSAEVAAALGTALAAAGVEANESYSFATAAVLATLLGAAATATTYRLHLQVAAAGAAVVTTGAWLTLAGDGLFQAFVDGPTWQALWLDFEVWPLLVAAGLVAGLAVLRRLPRAARVGAVAVAHLLLVCAALAPVVELEPTAVTLVGLGVLVAAALATWLLPRPWGLVNALTQAVVATGVALVGLALTVDAVIRLAELADPVWSGRAEDLLPAGSLDQPAAWLLPLCVLALAATGWALAEASGEVDRVVALLFDLRGAAAVLAASVVAALALYPVPVWLVLGGALAVVVGFTAWWLTSGSLAPLAPATLFAAGGLVVSLHAEVLTGLTLLALVAFTALVHLRTRASELTAVAGVAFAGVLAASVWTWGAVRNAEPTWVVLVALLLLGVLVLAAPYAPARWWASITPAVARTGVEVGAAVSATALGLTGVALAPTRLDETWTAVYLTVAGVVVTVMSLLRADRRALAWAGGALLALSSWVRLWDLGVEEPEAYTLPSAVVLLLVGLWHLRRTPLASTMTALAPGLSLALVPSLLWALADPTGLRPVLLGVGCLLLVMAGARLGWTAPIALGATVGALLVLRLAAPYVGDAVPRWVLIGGAGALLVAVGATWERRLQEARHLVAYVRTLR